jgi:hypothetical protein|tara:strand:- start:434 stop:673 length:240 start_codon:yes stop_codon:yes gene_type:complete
MAYQTKTALKAIVTTKNGQQSIEFISYTARYEQADIKYITDYFNPLTGLFTQSFTVLNFDGDNTLLIDQDFVTTAAELV